jgi:hypothetical protein
MQPQGRAERARPVRKQVVEQARQAEGAVEQAWPLRQRRVVRLLRSAWVLLHSVWVTLHSAQVLQRSVWVTETRRAGQTRC